MTEKDLDDIIIATKFLMGKLVATRPEHIIPETFAIGVPVGFSNGVFPIRNK